MNTETTLYDQQAYKQSCIPMLQDYGYHVVRGDLRMLYGCDTGCNAVIRFFETQTNYRIGALRRMFDIPEDVWPNEADLWIPGSTLREMEAKTQGVRGKSSYPRYLRRLLASGDLRSRLIARRGSESCTEPFTIIWTQHLPAPDDEGPYEYIEVEEVVAPDGVRYEYLGFDGVRYDACDQGWTVIDREYRLEFESIYAAMLAKARRSAPKLERHGVISRWRQGAGIAATIAAAQATTNPYFAEDDDDAKDETMKQGARSSTNTTRADIGSSDFQNTITNVDVSTNSTKGTAARQCHNNVAHCYRNVTLSAEAILGLSSAVLPVPPRPPDDDEEALRQWLIDWFEPAVWLYQTTKGDQYAWDSPVYAWQCIDRHIRGMISSSIWYATKRVRKTLPTLRQVVGYDKDLLERTGELRLTGEHWRSVEKELGNWQPSETTPYDGPPMEYYVQGYTGTTPGNEQPQNAPYQRDVLTFDDGTNAIATFVDADTTDLARVGTAKTEPSKETPAGAEPTTETLPAVRASPARGLTTHNRDLLLHQLKAAYPSVIIDQIEEVAPDRWVVAVAVNDTECIEISSAKQWRIPSLSLLEALDQAQTYGETTRSRDAPPGDDGGDMQGQVMNAEEAT